MFLQVCPSGGQAISKISAVWSLLNIKNYYPLLSTSDYEVLITIYYCSLFENSRKKKGTSELVLLVLAAPTDWHRLDPVPGHFHTTISHQAAVSSDKVLEDFSAVWEGSPTTAWDFVHRFSAKLSSTISGPFSHSAPEKIFFLLKKKSSPLCNGLKSPTPSWPSLLRPQDQTFAVGNREGEARHQGMGSSEIPWRKS